ncbi:Hsp20/alpha crystallin family protein [Rossellomorea sp. DA94]|uniref:Hsp20/alpha crystallin family protein n=1 Tax=Rossellomorea sp. DA94 TaxID=3038653 RepID=UPI00244AC10F|nr:Hsp20/alpha crystallin family protein [Rossellomorea sp. DA94]WGG46596.1 Hsp20/alpha crystallin family protein [Rossellomorea sp. DA94]
MDMEKMKKWLELTNQYKSDNFWNSVFENNNPSQFFSTDDEFPRYDVYQNESHVCIILDAPGITQDDIKFSLNSNTNLLIKGRIRPVYPKEMEVKAERFSGEFERTIPLPEPAEAKAINIQFLNGLIQVAYPRKIEDVSLHGGSQ